MYNWQPPTEVGSSIPAHEPHGVSVTLPTWAANVGYEEGADWVVSKIRSGYPRFCIHYKIQELSALLMTRYGRENEALLVFPANASAQRARDFIKRRAPVEGIAHHGPLRVLQLCTPKKADIYQTAVSVLFFPKELAAVAKQYWQHTGEGISSRQAEYFAEQFQEDSLATDRHQTTYVEERFGRNLDVSQASEAKAALRKRISQQISSHSVKTKPEEVYLYQTGMTAIFSAHRLAMEVQQSEAKGLKSVCFGFPYTDTLKILEKWGPGVHFFPRGGPEDLMSLTKLLEGGERISALFCEFPSNPLLRTPDIIRIRKLADEYKFLVVVDETLGNVCNVDVMPYEDISVSSLTKIFSGESNVMGGSLVLNSRSPYFCELTDALTRQYSDVFWAEDAIYLERNSRDFVERNRKTNANAQAVVELLIKSSIVKTVHYPPLQDTHANYEAVRVAGGGYGGLLSIVFKQPEMAVTFFDAINIHKGPSLGTNFTLACPYTIIAHYTELDYVESCGVDRYLVRISVGLEDTEDLLTRVEKALAAAAEAVPRADLASPIENGQGSVGEVAPVSQ